MFYNYESLSLIALRVSDTKSVYKVWHLYKENNLFTK